MPDAADPITAPAEAAHAPRPRDLPPAAQRALAEAAERRRLAAEAAAATAPEHGGRNGPEPVRYGDWELKGVAVDF
jgi:hypothetical protein